MPVVVALLLVVAVHLGTNLAAWGQVGLLADDRFAVGLPILLEWNHASLGERAHAIFLPVVDEGASTALYRPVVSLLFCLEQPWFGVDARWYHAVNSLFHCATAMAWFALVRRWSGLWVAGLAVALAFVGWPGHSEVTHWVSARVNLCAVCFMSLSLFAWDTAERRGANGSRWPMTGVALFLGLLALGSKESAILLLPAAFLVSWLRMGDAGGMVARGWHSALRVLPLFLLFLAFAALRRFVLHTWGAGTSSAWQLDVTSPAAWGAAWWRWLNLLIAPVHVYYANAWWRPVLWVMHGGLLVAALSAARQRELRPVLAFAVMLFAVTLIAVSGLHVDAETLENIRYSYEPALALCLLLGLGIAGLPARVRGPALAAMVAVHAMVLDQNRECWLRGGAVHARMTHEVQQAAQAGPIRVFDGPGKYDGAFVYLIENSPQLLWWPPMPMGVLQGRISSTMEWQGEIAELAAATANKRSLERAFTVAWDDGSLLPVVLDLTWPQTPWSGTTIEYARIGRQRPFLGSDLPVQLLVRNQVAVSMLVRGIAGDRHWEGPVVECAASAGSAAVAGFLPLPEDLSTDRAIEVEVVVRGASGERVWSLGEVTPVARFRR